MKTNVMLFNKRKYDLSDIKSDVLLTNLKTKEQRIVKMSDLQFKRFMSGKNTTAYLSRIGEKRRLVRY